MITSHMQFAIVDYLKQYPRQYIDVEKLQIKLIKRTEYIESFSNAIEDLITKGRVVANKDKVKIVQ